MANAGRKTKYTPKTVERILQLLRDGNTDTDTCALSGVAQPTFYMWLKQKVEFSEAVARARSEARELAVKAWKSAFEPQDVATIAENSITETRLKRDGTPYDYKKTTRSKQIVKQPADWRAAESYLKRRDPDNWAEQLIIKVKPEQSELLKKHGITASDAFELFIQELANADAVATTDGS